MWREPGARALRWGLAFGLLVPAVWGCNVAIGAGIVAVAGTAGYLASPCYDQVRVRVHDQTGQRICNADVTLSEGDSVSSLRSCYHASLTEGRWRVAARLKGYEPASTEIVIPEHDGACPRYTHTIELTLRPVGAPSQPNQLRPPPPAAAPPAVTAPAPASLPPAGTDPSAPPPPPTATFPVAPAPGAPAPAPAPAPAAPAAPAPGAPVAPAPPPSPVAP